MRLIACIFSLLFGIFVIGNIVIVAQEVPVKISQKDREGAIKSLSENIKRSYVFPDAAEKIAAKLKANAATYASIDEGAALAEALTRDIQSINGDKHLRVRFSPEVLPERKEISEPSAEEIKERVAFMKRVNFGFESVKRLDGNIGYIELRGFMDPAMGENTVAAAMDFIANTDALIFDLRRNGGGDPEMVQLICSYFFGDDPVHLNDLYWREGDQTKEFWTTPKVRGAKYLGKDIYILTSSRTFSGAEEFSYNLKNLKRASIVGETTGGGAHPGGFFRLGDHFSAFISTGRAINPITKTNWEGTGVKPDVETSADAAYNTAYLQAIEKSLKGTVDPDLKRALSDLAERLRKELGKGAK
ncbi:MAG: S41 family peptidase [Pyrinomonadaceae bacterium]